MPVVMKPLVFTYLVRYEFSAGVGHVSVARGALAGMAESVFLHDGHTDGSTATILYDCTVHDWGVEARVNSFGSPNYPNPDYGSRAEGIYGLNLEVKLKNGKIKVFNFDISDQVRVQPHGGVITVTGIEISDQEAAGSPGSGFDVSIDDWGEFNDVIIDL